MHATHKSFVLKAALGALGAAIACAFSASLSAADSTPSQPPSISVSATGSVSYVPNIARLSLGVRAESPTAGGAAADVNGRAQAVINALRRSGIASKDLKTSGYTLEYQQPPSPEPGPLMPPSPASGGNADQNNSAPTATIGVARGFPNESRLVLRGSYVANETIDIAAPVSRAGAAIDAAISAGANQTYGLSYDTTQRDRLYRDALTAAVRAARSQAADIARAAGVTLGALQSISTFEASRAPGPEM
ncbi:MAG: SIMPL domain-containing protein, partial [Candidatus Eremiobacteraeota bacterium]|nr:SIMPL domain-containing protein [Candidatus Eremiobacteraeota bacterium]